MASPTEVRDRVYAEVGLRSNTLASSYACSGPLASSEEAKYHQIAATTAALAIRQGRGNTLQRQLNTFHLQLISP